MKSNLSTVGVDEFVALTQNNKNTMVVDVRTAAEVDNEYFEGSVNLPLQEISVSSLKSLLSDRGFVEGETIYLLCGSGQRAQKAAEYLTGAIVNRIVVIEGGINALKHVGHSVKKGKGRVISLERQVRIVAGVLVLVGVVLGAFLTPVFYCLSALVGVGLIFAGVSDTCAMAMLLVRLPWNRMGG